MTEYIEYDDGTRNIRVVEQGPRKMSIVHGMCVTSIKLDLSHPVETH
jgi:hypothetical protein